MDGRQETSCFDQRDTPVARSLHKRSSVFSAPENSHNAPEKELTHFGLDHSLCQPIHSLGGFELPRSEC